MALTLADVAKLQKDPLTKGFMDIFLEERELAQFVPVEKTDTMKFRTARTVSLPTPGWRSLGENHSESKGSWDFIEDTVFSAGNTLTVDHLLQKDKSLVKDPVQSQSELFAKALAYLFNDTFINGDPTVNSEQPAGLNYRVQRLDSSQTIDASALDVSTGSARDSNGLALIDYLDQLIDQVDGKKPDVILCNLKFYQALRSILMRKGLWAANKDQFGNEIPTYRGAKIIDVSYKADQSSLIISNTMDTNTSVFAVRLGPEYFHMREYLPLTVSDLGKLPGTKNLYMDVEWVFGFHDPHPRSIAKLKNVKVV